MRFFKQCPIVIESKKIDFFIILKLPYRMDAYFASNEYELCSWRLSCIKFKTNFIYSFQKGLSYGPMDRQTDGPTDVQTYKQTLL